MDSAGHARSIYDEIEALAFPIPVKHLLTLQEGVSEGQFQEMREAGVHLVVPTGLHAAYPSPVRAHLISFESFICETRLLNLSSRTSIS